MQGLTIEGHFDIIIEAAEKFGKGAQAMKNGKNTEKMEVVSFARPYGTE